MNTITLDPGVFFTVGLVPLTKNGKPAPIEPSALPDISNDSPLIVDLALPDPTKMTFQIANLGDGGMARITAKVRPVGGPADGSQDVTGILTITALADTRLATLDFQIVSGPTPIPLP